MRQQSSPVGPIVSQVWPSEMSAREADARRHQCVDHREAACSVRLGYSPAGKVNDFKVLSLSQNRQRRRLVVLRGIKKAVEQRESHLSSSQDRRGQIVKRRRDRFRRNEFFPRWIVRIKFDLRQAKFANFQVCSYCSLFVGRLAELE